MLDFLGNYEAKVDAKARVFVPAVFRKILQSSAQNSLILRKDIFQECLVLYPLSVWDAELDKLRLRLNRWNKQQQQVFRQFVVDAERLDIDASGRILIPKKFMQMIDVSSDVLFLGTGDTIELWKQEALSKTLLPADEFGAMLQGLMSDSDII